MKAILRLYQGSIKALLSSMKGGVVHEPSDALRDIGDQRRRIAEHLQRAYQPVEACSKACQQLVKYVSS
jgi:hypothetical protein